MQIAPGMSAEENRAAYEQFCRRVLIEGDVAAMDDLVDPEVITHAPFPGQGPGRQGFKDAFTQFRSAFPNLRVSIRDIVAGEEKVIGYFTVSGVHSGGFLGLPATGKTVTYEEMVIVRFANGRIVEHWSVADTLSMMQSLGLVTDAHRAATPLHAERVRDFFDRYAERFNKSLAAAYVDSREVAQSFASHFVEASPVGVSGGKNGIFFRWMIPRGFAHYRRLGTTHMLVSHVSVESIDTLNALARVQWDSRYRKKDGSDERIEFQVTYLLHFEAGEPKIFAYITGDEARLLRAHGLS